MSKTILVERDVETPMRDGVILRADVYRPNASDPLPVLLQRTPYGKGFSNPAFALMAAERGYAVVMQDTRGRWASDGDGYPFAHEMADGYDSVEWAAHQPWSNGQVGMFGGSYVGYTQLAAAATRPPSLKAITPMVTFCDPYDICYSNGAFALGVALTWTIGAQASMAIMRSTASEADKAQLMNQLVALTDGLTQGQTLRHLPLGSLPLIGEHGMTPFLWDTASQSRRDDPLWQQLNCRHADIAVPALHIGGWYDIFAESTPRDFAALRSDAGSELARTSQKLLMGPWYHGPLEGLVGEVDFGMQASSAMVLPDEVQMRWFDYWLKGVDNGIMSEPPVRIFVMGDNQWRNENEWPLARTHYTPFYLHSDGAANTLNGNGSLSADRPADEPVDTYVYDPRNPVPTRGGGLCCSPAVLPAGAFDQRAVEARPDVLVYSSAALDHDTEVTGPIQVHLWAATTAIETDFTAKLVDVHTCGYARNVTDGIIRAHRQPGDAQKLVFDLPPTSNVFKAGHRIRVEISSSNFPHFDRNLNTGQSSLTSSAMRPATQSILHDADHPSHLVLPVIPR